MKDWQRVMDVEAEIDRPEAEKRVLGFLSGGAVMLGSEKIRLPWTDRGALYLAHNSRQKRRNLVIGVPGVPSTLGMLTVLRDTVMSMISRYQGGRFDGEKLPGKVLWLAPKADMSQAFRRAVFAINGHVVAVREASRLVSLDTLEQKPPTTTVAFLRDFYRVGEALEAHRFESIVIDDPYGQVCNTPQATSEQLQRVLAISGHPRVVAVVPARALPDPAQLNAPEGVTVWPWTADLGAVQDPAAFAASAKGAMAGSPIQRSQVAFDAASLLPPSVVITRPAKPATAQLMEEVWQISARLAQEAYKLESPAERRLVGEARAAVLALEALAMPLTFHEGAAARQQTHNRSRSISERLAAVDRALFTCSPAIRDDLSVLLDRIGDLLKLLRTDVPKWNCLVELLKAAKEAGRKTALAVPNLLAQEALFKALQVEFPEHPYSMPWELCTVSAVPKLGEIDELIVVGLPTVRQNWVLRYPVCADRKLLVWPFHQELGIWLAAPPLVKGAEQLRQTGWTEVGSTLLAEQPDTLTHDLPRVAVLDCGTGAKAYYDIPLEPVSTQFAWHAPTMTEEDDEEEEAGGDEEGLLPTTREDNGNSLVTEHLVLHLDDGSRIYALDEDFFDVVKDKEVVSAAALSLERGQTLLLIRGHSYIKLRNLLMESADRRYQGIWFEEDWNRWRALCRGIPAVGRGFREFVENMRDKGCDKDEITIRSWLKGAVMAPSSVKDIQRVAAVAQDGLMLYFAKRFHEGMKDLRGRHAAFGRWLKRIVVTQERLNDYEVIDSDLDFTVGDLRSSVSRHVIRKIERCEGRPPHRTGELIKPM